MLFQDFPLDKHDKIKVCAKSSSTWQCSLRWNAHLNHKQASLCYLIWSKNGYNLQGPRGISLFNLLSSLGNSFVYTLCHILEVINTVGAAANIDKFDLGPIHDQHLTSDLERIYDKVDTPFVLISILALTMTFSQSILLSHFDIPSRLPVPLSSQIM